MKMFNKILLTVVAVVLIQVSGQAQVESPKKIVKQNNQIVFPVNNQISKRVTFDKNQKKKIREAIIDREILKAIRNEND